ncbi:MAG: hypothetical protein ACRDFR_03760, partial [Candidatus Limnocylindria bacterium]
MSDQPERPEPVATPSREGLIYAVLAAALAGILLFLPILLVGFSLYVVAAVARGEGLGWQSGVAMTYAFIGIPAFIGLVLLVIPYALFRASARRVGTQQAVRWVGRGLVVWHAGVALIWAWDGMSGTNPAGAGDAIWYALAFGLAAVVIWIGTIVVEKEARGAALALFGVVVAGLVGLVAVVAAVWGTPLRIPPDAQEVHIVVTESTVTLEPATVHAGDVYFIVDESADATGDAAFTFVSRGEPGQEGADPLPLSDEDVARLAEGDY